MPTHRGLQLLRHSIATQMLAGGVAFDTIQSKLWMQIREHAERLIVSSCAAERPGPVCVTAHYSEFDLSGEVRIEETGGYIPNSGKGGRTIASAAILATRAAKNALLWTSRSKDICYSVVLDPRLS